MSKYAGTEDPINLESLTEYQYSVDDYKGGASSEGLPVTPPEFELGPNLQSLSRDLQLFQLNSTSLHEASEASKAFRERIHENQLQANGRSIRQY